MPIGDMEPVVVAGKQQPEQEQEDESQAEMPHLLYPVMRKNRVIGGQGGYRQSKDVAHSWSELVRCMTLIRPIK